MDSSGKGYGQARADAVPSVISFHSHCALLSPPVLLPLPPSAPMFSTFHSVSTLWGPHSLLPWLAAAAAAKSLQSCPTLWDPIDGSPSGSPVPGILQARTLEWVAISFSNAWKWKVKVKSLSRVRLLATPPTAAHWAPPSMGFSRQEFWSGCHCLLQVGSISLFQRIFWTQKSNQGLQYCR